jgi:hypothetical protein
VISNDNPVGCKYYVSEQESDTQNNENPESPKTFNVIIRTTNDYNKTLETYEQAVNVWKNGNIPNRTYKEAENIGYKAFWAYSSNTPQLITHDENHLLIITLGNFNEEESVQLQSAKKIAEQFFNLLSS